MIRNLDPSRFDSFFLKACPTKNAGIGFERVRLVENGIRQFSKSLLHNLTSMTHLLGVVERTKSNVIV